MEQEIIWNRAAVDCRPHLHWICSKLQYNCTTMDADRLAMIGALVQQQNQNHLRLQQAVEREDGETELCGSDSGYWEGLNMDCMTSWWRSWGMMKAISSAP
jgi:hypothetical protein